MTGSQLKILACLFMLIDHIGSIIYPDQLIYRVIGRLAFPLFAYLIVEGYHHTSDLKIYIKRFLIIGLIAEPIFDLSLHGSLFDWQHQNIFFTLAIGLIFIHFMDKFSTEKIIYKILLVFTMMILVIITKVDYGLYGILLIYSFYSFRENKFNLFVGLATLNIIFGPHIQYFSMLALPLIYLYNGKKGISKKLVFYAFYPLHLILLYLVKVVF